MLELANLCAGYGDTDIIRDIALTVGEREVVTIAGTNGAGKSTLVKAIMGIVPRCRGTLRFCGQDLIGLRAEDRLRLGISYVPQVANVFPTLTVHENLQVTQVRGSKKAHIAAMYELYPALAARRRSQARVLSGGERQQLAFARALICEPRLIILDEPTAALSPALSTQVFSQVRALTERGVAVLMIEQRARQSLRISDRGYILDAGAVAMAGKAADLLNDSAMAELYLGIHEGH